MAKSTVGWLFEWGFTEPEAPDDGAGLQNVRFLPQAPRLVPTMVRLSGSSGITRVHSYSAGNSHFVVSAARRESPDTKESSLSGNVKESSSPSRVYICGALGQSIGSFARREAREEELAAMGVLSCRCGSCNRSFPVPTLEQCEIGQSDREVLSQFASVRELDGRKIAGACVVGNSMVYVWTDSGCAYKVQRGAQKFSVVPLMGLVQAKVHQIASVQNASGSLIMTGALVELDEAKNRYSQRSMLLWGDVPNLDLGNTSIGNYTSPSLFWKPEEDNDLSQLSLSKGLSLSLSASGNVYQSELLLGQEATLTSKQLESLSALEAVSTPSRRQTLQSIRFSLSRKEDALTTKSSRLSKNVSTISDAPLQTPTRSGSGVRSFANRSSALRRTPGLLDTSYESRRSVKSSATDDLNRSRYSSQILSIYSAHSPEKVEKAGFLRRILKQFKGRENELLRQLARKYANQHHDIVYMGPGRLRNEIVPHQVKISGVACGRKHALAVSETGSVFSWNHSGDKVRILDFLMTPQGEAKGKKPQPTPVRIQKVACGDAHSVALSSTSGHVFSWGDNGSGQLGHGDKIPRQEPTYLALPLSDVTDTVQSIVCGHSTTFLVLNSGKCYAAGSNAEGRLGTGTPYNDRVSPTMVEFPNGYVCKAVAPGRSLTVFLTLPESRES